MTTVEDKIYNYSVVDYSHSKYYTTPQYDIGRPRMAEFIKIVEKNLMINCPVIKDYINISEEIWVTNLSYLKGKTTRQKTL